MVRHKSHFMQKTCTDEAQEGSVASLAIGEMQVKTIATQHCTQQQGQGKNSQQVQQRQENWATYALLPEM